MESPQIRQFASDNYAGICPEAWEFMQRANSGHAAAYGNDRWTEQASDLLRDVFEKGERLEERLDYVLVSSGISAARP